MALKPRHKRRIFWSIISLIGAVILSIIIVPPMITLNKFRPFLETSILEQTNVPAKLDGDIHFSLIGGATIVVHNVNIPTAHIGALLLSIPFHDFFDIKNAKLDRTVVIYDADIKIDKLEPAAFNHNIEIYNSDITFRGKKFHIIRADFTNGEFHGTIRSAHHKYDVEFIGDKFHIKNKNNKLDIVGTILENGAIRGHMSLTTDDINGWFNFQYPKITKTISLTMNFEWNGDKGYKFTNIESDNFSGNIEIFANGNKDIQLVSNNMNFDFSFLLKPNHMLHQTKLNLDFYGNLKLSNHKFNHIKIQAIGTHDKLQIQEIIADDIIVTGGTITKNGAENITISMPLDGIRATCVFSGTPKDWNCNKFSYDDMFGQISSNNGVFDIYVKSNQPIPSNNRISNLVSKIGQTGKITFMFSNLGGTYDISPKGTTASYTFAKDKTLDWLNIKMDFMPKFMRTAHGDFELTQGMYTFTPYDNDWKLSLYDNYFHLTGKSIKEWLAGMDLRFANDSDYTISGFYDNGKISNLNIQLGNHEFTGTVSEDTITLHTKQLNIDEFISQEFLRRYSEQQFLTNAPLMTIFDTPVKISLSADSVIYNGTKYNNFVYVLKPNSQIFSITDNDRGNLLATITKDKINYDIFIQLNRFLINDTLLSKNMPLNVRDSAITAEIHMNTHGQIANDISYNMTGTMDMTFDGGYLLGMNFDEFYASANNITTLNAEYAFARALTSGETRIKKMRIQGEYSSGNFITTEPIELSMRHTTAAGGLAISDGQMTAEFDITMRGTAPTPATIELGILPDGNRQYSLSEIMRKIDPGFMRAFVETHTQF
ncbi:MAG: hypothetical protein J6R22_02045 [Alphaproteobacteria bacterium]|nr:hypothetical protein [Alphaproteobacteria bacterium]